MSVMKQMIPFTKEITFKSKIKELTSISLDDDLTLKGEDLIVGNFYIKGTYKRVDNVTLDEEYSYKIPCEIAISDEYDTFDCSIDIDDFYYEIVNDEILRVNITVLIDNLNKREVVEEKNIRGEEEIPSLDEVFLEDEAEVLEEIPSKKEEERCIDYEDDEVSSEVSKTNSLEKTNVHIHNSNIINISDDDTYLTYSVYIFREGDDLDQILEKYKIKKEDLANYNNLSEVLPGDKLIIPSFLSND